MIKDLVEKMQSKYNQVSAEVESIYAEIHCALVIHAQMLFIRIKVR